MNTAYLIQQIELLLPQEEQEQRPTMEQTM